MYKKVNGVPPSSHGTAAVLLSAVAFATLPIFTTYAYAAGIPLTALLAYRFLGAAAVLTAWTVLRGHSLAVPDRRLRRQLLLLGATGYTLQAGLFLASLAYITPALAALALYTYPVIVYLFAVLTHDDSFAWPRLGLIVLSFAGISLVLGAAPQGHDFLLGTALALGAAVVYSAYIIAGNRLVKAVTADTTSVYVTACGGAVYGIISLTTGALRFPLPPAWWWPVAAIILIPTVAAIALFFVGLQRIGPTRAAVYSNIEPLCTVAFSWWAFGEHLAPLQLAGAAMVIAGAVVINLLPAARCADNCRHTG